MTRGIEPVDKMVFTMGDAIVTYWLLCGRNGGPNGVHNGDHTGGHNGGHNGDTMGKQRRHNGDTLVDRTVYTTGGTMMKHGTQW